MIGMVLAAGAGRRLRPYTNTLPKALVPVNGETTILDIALGNLAAVDLREVVVVVGYKSEAVEQRQAELEQAYGVRLTLVHNDKAEEWNNAYSMWLARDYFAQGVLMVNGDTVHPVSIEQTLLAAHDTDPKDLRIALDTEKPLAEEEMKVTVSEHGWLARISKQLDPAQAYGEYIGATLVGPTGADKLADALKTTWERNPDLYYEDGYQEMADRGQEVSVTPIGTVSWVEVDDHADLAKARKIACHY